MKHIQGITITFILLFANFGVAKCQTPLPYFSFEKGTTIARSDSTSALNIRFRLQNRADFSTEDLTGREIQEVDGQLRLLFQSGFSAIKSNWQYKIGC